MARTRTESMEVRACRWCSAPAEAPCRVGCSAPDDGEGRGAPCARGEHDQEVAGEGGQVGEADGGGVHGPSIAAERTAGQLAP